VLTLSDHRGPVKGIAISADEKMLISGSADHTMKIWDLSTYKPVHILNHRGPVTSVAISADQRTLMSGGDDERIMVWGTQSIAG